MFKKFTRLLIVREFSTIFIYVNGEWNFPQYNKYNQSFRALFITHLFISHSLNKFHNIPTKYFFFGHSTLFRKLQSFNSFSSTVRERLSNKRKIVLDQNDF